MKEYVKNAMSNTNLNNIKKEMKYLFNFLKTSFHQHI